MAFNSKVTTTEKNIQRASHHFLQKSKISERYPCQSKTIRSPTTLSRGYESWLACQHHPLWAQYLSSFSLTGHVHYTLNKTVSTRNLVSGFIKQHFGSRQRSLSFVSFLSRRERPLLAGNRFTETGQIFNK